MPLGHGKTVCRVDLRSVKHPGKARTINKDGDITGIDIPKLGRRIFPKVISRSYFQKLFTVVVKTDKLNP